jgi:signal transduction histidine kinase
MLKHLISSMLDYARINAKIFTRVMKPFNLNEVVEEVVNIQRYQADRVGVKILTTYKVSDQNMKVVSDPDRIQQVILNILSNAIKFTPSGSIHILSKIIFDEFKNKHFLKVTIKDTGVGISKEN